MSKKMLVKLAIPILALVLSACGTADNNNKDVNDMAPDTNAPAPENDMDTDTNDTPKEDVNNDPGKEKNEEYQDKEKPEYQKQDQDPDMNSDNGRRGG